MNVLVVTNMYPDPQHPMLGTFVKTQVESLRRQGLTADVLFINGVASRWNYLKGWFDLKARLRERRYDLIHAHYGLTGWVARLQGKCPLIVSFSGDDVFGTPEAGGRYGRLPGMIARASGLLARCSDAVIVKSPAMKARLGFPEAYVIPNGVDFDRFKPLSREQSRIRLGLDVRKRYVLFPSNPETPVKRFDVVRGAFDIVQRDLENVELLTVWKAFHEDMPLYMNASDVLVLTSQHEGSPNAVKEAMACDLPIVAVDVGDVREVVEGTRNCHIVERTPKEIAEKLRDLLLKSERSDGRSRVRHLSLQAVARQVITVYEKALEGSCGF